MTRTTSPQTTSTPAPPTTTPTTTTPKTTTPTTTTPTTTSPKPTTTTPAKVDIDAIRDSHLAILDAYIDQRLRTFEAFFFRNYGVAYLRHWRVQFNERRKRPYQQQTDFGDLYNDLVSEYQSLSRPLEDLRVRLRKAIAESYGSPGQRGADSLSRAVALTPPTDVGKLAGDAARQQFTETLTAMTNLSPDEEARLVAKKIQQP